MPVELRQLRFIVAAAKHRSFRHAAASLGIKQSTLSRAVRTVEERLNVKLFERNNGGARMTAAGAAFLQGADLVIRMVDGIVHGAKAAGRGESGRFVVGCHDVDAAANLHALITAFRETSPAAEIIFVEGSHDQLAAQVGAGAVDVAILPGDPVLPDLAFTPAWMSRIVAVLPETHPLAERDVLHWSDLAGVTLLGSCGDPGPEIAAVLRARLGSPDVHSNLVMHDVRHAALLRLVALGLGPALVCESNLAPGHGVVVRSLRDGAGMSGVSYVAAYRRGSHNPMLERFLRLLAERYPSVRPPDLAGDDPNLIGLAMPNPGGDRPVRAEAWRTPGRSP